jgi:Flp pilus assembly protein TadG
MRQIFRLLILAIAILAVVLIVVERGNVRRQTEQRISPVQQEAATLARAAALEARARRNLAENLDGRHCLDPETGALPGIYAYVRRQLADPDTFRPVASEITPTTPLQGSHLLKLTYRAERKPGEDYQRTETFVVQNADCSFER